MSAAVRALVGLCGYAGAGKDTAARGLLGRGWVRVAFADALKAEVARGLGVHADAFGAALADPVFKARVRPLLVEWGRYRRLADPDYWVRAAPLAAAGAPGVVVTDVRYANEALRIRDAGGVVIRVSRAGVGPANAEEALSLEAFEPDFIVDNAEGDPGRAASAVLAIASGLSSP